MMSSTWMSICVRCQDSEVAFKTNQGGYVGESLLKAHSKLESI